MKILILAFSLFAASCSSEPESAMDLRTKSSSIDNVSSETTEANNSIADSFPEIVTVDKQIDYVTNIEPVLKRYCISCHGSGSHSKTVLTFKEIAANPASWERVIELVSNGVMPPAPSLLIPSSQIEKTVELFTAWKSGGFLYIKKTVSPGKDVETDR